MARLIAKRDLCGPFGSFKAGQPLTGKIPKDTVKAWINSGIVAREGEEVEDVIDSDDLDDEDEQPRTRKKATRKKTTERKSEDG